MRVEVRHYIKSLEDYNDRSIIFYIEDCREQFIEQCSKEKLDKRYRFRKSEPLYFWYIDNMEVHSVQELYDIDMAYPITILELFADEDGLYYIDYED